MKKKPIINAADVQELRPAYFVTDASSVGLLVGDFPEFIETTLGNKQPLVRCNVDRGAGDINSVVYAQQLGNVVVKIFND